MKINYCTECRLVHTENFLSCSECSNPLVPGKLDGNSLELYPVQPIESIQITLKVVK